MPASLEISMRLLEKFAGGGAEANTPGLRFEVGAIGITGNDAGGRAGEITASARGIGAERTGTVGSSFTGSDLAALGAGCETGSSER